MLDLTDHRKISGKFLIIFLKINENFKWIQKGCGDKEYYCEEKNATFLASDLPDELPDLSEHK